MDDSVKKKTDPEYREIIKAGSEEIREKVLKYIMVRRTRSEIKEYFSGVKKEMGKVSWLTRPEMTGSTIVVFSFCIIMALYEKNNRPFFSDISFFINCEKGII